MRWQAAAVAALVAAAAAVFIWTSPEGVREPVRLAAWRPGPDPVPAVATAAPTAIPPTARHAAASSPRPGLATALEQATDLRQFVLDAMQRPGEGGLFYARHALQRCSGADQSTMDGHLQRAIQANGTVTPEQMRVADAAVRRCASFHGQEVRELFRRAVLQSRDGSDPYVNADRLMSEAFMGNDASRVRDAVARALELGDPLLMSRLTLAVTAGRPRETVDASIDEDDEKPLTPAQVDLALADVSIALAACRDGLACDYDQVRQMECLSVAAVCAPSREAHMRDFLARAGLSPKDIDRLPAMVARARHAMADKDVDFFVRP